MPDELLAVKNLKKYFPLRKGLFVRAVDGIDICLQRGETLGLVGESGSGKSTVAYTVVGMYAPTEGQVLFDGQDIGHEAKRRSLLLKQQIQIVFQDPGSSINPRRTIGKVLELPLRVHKVGDRQDRQQRVAELLRKVELPSEYRYKIPSNVGGGERQLVAIARALATNPSLIILDEPTSALDVSVQAKIINMLIKFQEEFDLAYLFITHDLSLMRNVAHRVAIMYLGKICETAVATEFFEQPIHPYTKMLLSSIPVVSEPEEAMKPKKIVSTGEIPSPVNIPPGCSFYNRCPDRLEVCNRIDPLMVEVSAGHSARCHVYAPSRELVVG